MAFMMERGVCQRKMQESKAGSFINGLPTGASAHADDISAITNSWDIQMPHSGLKLSVEKCEILSALRNASSLNDLGQEKTKPLSKAPSSIYIWHLGLTRDLICDVAPGADQRFDM